MNQETSRISPGNISNPLKSLIVTIAKKNTLICRAFSLAPRNRIWPILMLISTISYNLVFISLLL